MPMQSRRDFEKLALSGLSTLVFSRGVGAAAAIDSTIRGVKLGITTGSLNPLPDVPGKDRLDGLIEQCVQLSVGNVELASGFFGPAVLGTIGGRAPKQITPEYQKSRDAQREWRLNPASLAEVRSVRDRFANGGIDVFSISNTF